MHADPYARLREWKAAGGAQRDPLRYALAAALARRAQSRRDAVRTQLEQRLHAVLDNALDTPRQHPQQPIINANANASRPLQDVLRPLQPAACTPATGQGSTAQPAAPPQPLSTPDSPASASPVLDEFQQLWTQVRIDSLLRQCLDAAPEDAGPLHSSVLLHRAMSRMREVSPAYLQHFIAYVDALSWLEKMAPGKAAAAPATRSRRKPAASPRRKKE